MSLEASVLTVVLVADAVGQDGQEAVLLALLPEAEVRVPPVGQPQVDGELTRQPCQGRSKVLLHTCNQRGTRESHQRDIRETSEPQQLTDLLAAG